MSLGTKVFYVLSSDYAGTVLPTQEDQDPLPESISETGREDYESERDSLVNHAQRAGTLQLHELLRTQIPQLRRYFTERGKVWGKGRSLREITGKIHRSFHRGLL